MSNLTQTPKTLLQINFPLDFPTKCSLKTIDHQNILCYHLLDLLNGTHSNPIPKLVQIIMDKDFI